MEDLVLVRIFYWYHGRDQWFVRNILIRKVSSFDCKLLCPWVIIFFISTVTHIAYANESKLKQSWMKKKNTCGVCQYRREGGSQCKVVLHQAGKQSMKNVLQYRKELCNGDNLAGVAQDTYSRWLETVSNLYTLVKSHSQSVLRHWISPLQTILAKMHHF